MTSGIWFRTPEPGKAVFVQFKDIPEPPAFNEFRLGTQGTWDHPDRLAVRDGLPARMNKQAAYYAEPIDFVIGKVTTADSVTPQGLVLRLFASTTGLTLFDPGQSHWTVTVRPRDDAPITTFGAVPKQFDLPLSQIIQEVPIGGPSDLFGMNAELFQEEMALRGCVVSVSLPRWDPSQSVGEWLLDGIQLEAWADLPPEMLVPTIAQVDYASGRTYVQHPRSSVSRSAPQLGAFNPGIMAINFPDRQVYAVDEYRNTIPMIGVRTFSERAEYLTDDVVLYSGQVYRCATATGPGAFVLGAWARVGDDGAYDDGVW